MTVEEYKALQNKLHIAKLLTEAEEDITNGRVYDIKEVFAEIEKDIEKRKNTIKI